MALLALAGAASCLMVLVNRPSWRRGAHAPPRSSSPYSWPGYVQVVLSPWSMYRAWVLRSIPGDNGRPFLGHLLQIMRMGSAFLFLELRRRYGSVFKVWVGRQPVVVLTDPDHVRNAGYKCINRSRFTHLLRGAHRELVETDLLAARDEMWRLLRKAWQPAFSSGSLSGYLALMDQSARKMASLLDKRCGNSNNGDGGGWGERFDIHWELGRMTLQVVGTCAYGVDFQTLEEESAAGEGKDRVSSPGLALASACKVIFESSSLARGSAWGRFNVMMPFLRPITSVLAYAFPDQSFRRQLEARDVIIRTATELIRSSTELQDRMQAAAGSEPSMSFKSGASETSQASPPTALSRSGSHGLTGGGSGVLGVLPGSFLGLMLAARDRQTGQKLTDLQIMAQAQTFILAGYETTANSLAFTVYLLGKHPEVQDKLVAEVDSLLDAIGGADAPLTEEALDQCHYLTAVINESLRLLPPAHVTTRHAKESLALGKHTVPAGSQLFLSIFAVHHDPQLWPNVDTFDPDRFFKHAAAIKPNSHIPFGVGARMCIGHKFAMLEAKTALIRLYTRLTFQLEPGQDPLPLAFGITATPKFGVWVRAKRRAGRCATA